MSIVLERVELERFRNTVAERLGLQFEDDKLDRLGDVLLARMRQAGCNRAASYLEQLTTSVTGRAELTAVAAELTVAETYFFRHPDHFRAFVEIALPARARAGRPGLRMLSAGCASGEEPYTLAILVQEQPIDLRGGKIAIEGIDINPALIQRAAQGRYSAWSLRATPQEIQERWFRPAGREFVLDPALRTLVSFQERNLLEEDLEFWQPGAFDVIFFRNVLMYFVPEAARTVVARLARSLAPGGYLFLGPAETLRGISQDFHLRHTHDTFYYQMRGPEETRVHSQAPATVHADAPAAVSVPPLPGVDDTWVGAISQATERIRALDREMHLASGGAPRATGRGEGGRNSAPQHESMRGALTPSPPAPLPRSGGEGSNSLQPAKIMEDSITDRSPSATAVEEPSFLSSTQGQCGGDELLGFARELLLQERFDDALHVLQTLPPESERDADALLLRAVILTNRGNVAEAERVCRQVLALDEMNAGAHYLSALCREHAGDRLAAFEEDRTALYLDPAFAMPHLHLGLLAKRAGNVEAARRDFSQAVTLLAREDAARIFLLGGGFSREALVQLCQAELRACGGSP